MIPGLGMGLIIALPGLLSVWTLAAHQDSSLVDQAMRTEIVNDRSQRKVKPSRAGDDAAGAKPKSKLLLIALLVLLLGGGGGRSRFCSRGDAPSRWRPRTR